MLKKLTKDCTRAERIERALILLEMTLLMRLNEDEGDMYRLAHGATGRCCEFDKDRYFEWVDKMILDFKANNVVDVEKVMADMEERVLY